MSRRPAAGTAGEFIGEFADGRDAFSVSLPPERLTAAMMEEIAWELGYEGFPFERLERYAKLAKSLGAKMLQEYVAGKGSR